MIKIPALAFISLIGLQFLGCSHFAFNAEMCDSMQPGEVSTQCRTYNEEEAAKASLPIYNDEGECLNCNKPKAVEIRR